MGDQSSPSSRGCLARRLKDQELHGKRGPAGPWASRYCAHACCVCVGVRWGGWVRCERATNLNTLASNQGSIAAMMTADRRARKKND